MVGTVTGYLLCLLLVPVYVSMFPMWKYLTTVWGEEIFIYLPVVALILLLASCILIWRRAGKERRPASKTPIGVGLLLCIVGLLICDPEFPVKRIHVAEYLILSLIGRYAMSRYLGGVPLLFFSAGFAAILGIHDEFLQGLHPARTYGLRDMSVNALGSFGGGLIWHGLQFFARDNVSALGQRGRLREYCYIGWLLLGVMLLIWPAVYFRGLVIEMWTTLPLAAALVYFALYRDRFDPEQRHGIAAVSAVSLSLVFYPLLTRLSNVVFY